MPLLSVKISGEANRDLQNKVNKNLLQLTTDKLSKNPRLTAIAIEFIPKSQWYIGGETLENLNKNSFSLEIKITDETNTKYEKSQYIAAVYEFFVKELVNLAYESYIYINDVRAAAFGYGGATQEFRYRS
jgi:4-oxalocrotonate tautomerase